MWKTSNLDALQNFIKFGVSLNPQLIQKQKGKLSFKIPELWTRVATGVVVFPRASLAAESPPVDRQRANRH
jgi:hypothetical protein